MHLDGAASRGVASPPSTSTASDASTYPPAVAPASSTARAHVRQNLPSGSGNQDAANAAGATLTRSFRKRWPHRLSGTSSPAKSDSQHSIASPLATSLSAAPPTAGSATSKFKSFHRAPCTGARATNTYQKLAPSLARPASGRPRLKQGATVRELGEQLVQKQAELRRLQASRQQSPAPPRVARPDESGIPYGLQGILQQYTRIAQDVEYLTGPRSSSRSGGHWTTSSRQASGVASDILGLHQLPESERVPDLQAQQGPQAPEAFADGLTSQGASRSPRGRPRRECKSQDCLPSAFGLSSVLQRPPAAAARPSPPGKLQSPAKDFDAGSWIYILGSSASSVAARQLAKQQQRGMPRFAGRGGTMSLRSSM